MGYFHDGTDYNGVTFSDIFNGVTRMGSPFFETLRVRKLFAQKKTTMGSKNGHRIGQELIIMGLGVLRC